MNPRTRRIRRAKRKGNKYCAIVAREIHNGIERRERFVNSGWRGDPDLLPDHLKFNYSFGLLNILE